jgi:hypothetical protein
MAIFTSGAAALREANKKSAISTLLKYRDFNDCVLFLIQLVYFLLILTIAIANFDSSNLGTCHAKRVTLLSKIIM